MEQVGIKKKLVIEYDIISGTMDFNNDDEMSFAEILAALEYTKWMVHKNWNEIE